MKWIMSILLLGLLSCQNNDTAEKEADRLTLLHFSHSECETGEDAYNFKNEIISKQINDDTLHMQIFFIGNCCLDFYPVFYLQNDTLKGTMDNRDLEEHKVCDCLCCWNIEFSLQGISETTFVTAINGKAIPEKQPEKAQNVSVP